MAIRFRVLSLQLLERDVRLRLPFRFGVVTLTAAPQAFVRARIRFEGGAQQGREAEGGAAEMMVPKWFDKDPALSNEDNVAQLRGSLRAASGAYLAGGGATAWGHFLAHRREGLVASYGPALVDRALLDALCRGLGMPFHDCVARNVVGAEPLEGLDLPAFLAGLRPGESIAARHTVGLLDPVTAADPGDRAGDGLPETLEEVVARYGHRWFKLKVAGDPAADVARLEAIAAVLDGIPGGYRASLDGNEQYDDVEGVAELWSRLSSAPRLRQLTRSIEYIEQPVKRARALERPIGRLEKPVIIDESDDSLEAFPRARALGYRGVSSKTCKGLYKSLVNAARCARWNAEQPASGPGFFMTGEDLTIQPGLALQQDLALVSLLGLAHVERNGHHYVNGMAGLPEAEQAAFLDGHPDLYERSYGAVRPRIRRGELATGSLRCPGYASRALPSWDSMKEMPT